MDNIYNIAVSDDDASALGNLSRLICGAFNELNAEHDIKIFNEQKSA